MGWAVLLWCLLLWVPVMPISAQPLATVAGEPIHYTDIINYTRKWPQLSANLSAPGGPEKLLELVIMDRLLLAEALSTGLLEQYGNDETAALQRMQTLLFKRCDPASAQALEAFYQSNLDRFSTPEFVRLRRIGLPATENGQVQLLKLREQLDRGTLTPEEAIARHSVERNARSELGFIPLGQDATAQVLRSALEGVELGGWSQPVVQGDVAFIYQLIDRRAPIATPFTEIEAEVQDVYLERCNAARSQQVRDTLAERHGVEYITPN